jgi:hypothetical protein
VRFNRNYPARASHSQYGSFYVIARDLAKVLVMRIIGIDKTVYPFLAISRPELVISVDQLHTRTLLSKLAALTVMTHARA